MAQKVNLDIAQTLNITSRRGDTFALDITLKDSSGTVLPLVTSNYTFAMHVRTSAFEDGADGIILSTVAHKPHLAEVGVNGFVGTIENMKVIEGVGNNITNTGVVSIKISDTTMRKVPSGRYVYDLQWILPVVGSVDPQHTTILTGSFVVNEDVTDLSES